MKKQNESDFDDLETGLEDDVDVETFLRNVERRQRRTLRRSAWREIERRMERRSLSADLAEYYED